MFKAGELVYVEEGPHRGRVAEVVKSWSDRVYVFVVFFNSNKQSFLAKEHLKTVTLENDPELFV